MAPSCQRAVGYDATTRQGTAQVAPLPLEGGTRDLDDYNDLLVDLAGDMMQRLRALRVALEQRRQREAAAARLAADGGQVIYLHARVTDADAWQRAGDVLAKRASWSCRLNRTPSRASPR